MTSGDSAGTFKPGSAGERPGDEPNSPWLPGGYPAPGTVARARIRNGRDIETIEAVMPADVLPSPTIYECIRTASRLNPLKPAVVHLRSADSEVPPRTLTYAQLLDSIERAASLFRDAAPTERSSVGIILPMVPEALIAAWAGATAGIANPINPYLQLDHVTALLNASRVTVLVVGCAKHGRGAWERLTEIVERVPTLHKVLIVDSDDPTTDFAMAIAARPPGL